MLLNLFWNATEGKRRHEQAADVRTSQYGAGGSPQRGCARRCDHLQSDRWKASTFQSAESATSICDMYSGGTQVQVEEALARKHGLHSCCRVAPWGEDAVLCRVHDAQVVGLRPRHDRGHERQRGHPPEASLVAGGEPDLERGGVAGAQQAAGGQDHGAAATARGLCHHSDRALEVRVHTRVLQSEETREPLARERRQLGQQTLAADSLGLVQLPLGET